MINSFKTLKYEGAWIPFNGDRTRFRFLVEQFLREALKDSEGTLVVDVEGPHWNGREELAGLSYSNTRGWGLVLFSRTHRLGVDIEREDRALKENYLKLANRFFHESEFVAIQKESIFDGSRAFLDLWMKKEAYSKMKRKQLVEFIKVAVLGEAQFESPMKVRVGYRAVVVLEL